MYKAALFALFSFLVCSASSQRIYFIYLQSETQRPFFIKLGDKLQSSSASGYLILSRLKDSTYTFAVGFTGKIQDEPVFTCPINKKDHGYLLKYFENKGWALVDIQTASIQMAASEGKKDASAVDVPVNAFTDLLAKAADDSTLKQNNRLPEEKITAMVIPPVVKNEELNKSEGTKEPTTVRSGPADKEGRLDTSKDTAVPVPASTVIKQKEDSKASPINKPERKPAVADTFKLESVDTSQRESDVKKAGLAVALEKPMNSNAPFTRSKVARKSESATTEGLGLTYIDTNADGSQDTIRLVIPEDVSVRLNDTAIPDPAIVRKETEKPVTDSMLKTANNGSLKKADGKNSCRDIATDADFYKLRKKMAAGKSDGDMLTEAKRSFKAKCYTTRQVKNLGTLFLGDGGKYNFFEAAVLHITDPDNFVTLQSELKDDYFINRFKSLLH